MTDTTNQTPDQPDGIEDDSFDLPDPARAAERVGDFLSAYGDGLIEALVAPEFEGAMPPLYARDLEALRKLADHAGTGNTATTGDVIERAAQIAYEATNLEHGRTWDAYPEWQKKSARKQIRALADAGLLAARPDTQDAEGRAFSTSSDCCDNLDCPCHDGDAPSELASGLESEPDGPSQLARQEPGQGSGDTEGERVEWNPVGDTWLSATVIQYRDTPHLVIELDDGHERLLVETRHTRPRVWTGTDLDEPTGVTLVKDKGDRRWCRSRTDSTWYLRDISGPVHAWPELLALAGPLTEVRPATSERTGEAE